jgi:hypothetical protein
MRGSFLLRAAFDALFLARDVEIRAASQCNPREHHQCRAYYYNTPGTSHSASDLRKREHRSSPAKSHFDVPAQRKQTAGETHP